LHKALIEVSEAVSRKLFQATSLPESGSPDLGIWRSGQVCANLGSQESGRARRIP